MRSIAFALVAAILSDCAPAIQKPSLYPATLAVDWSCVDADAQSELVRGLERLEHDAAMKVLDANARAEMAEKKELAAKLEANENKTWALLGKIGVAGIIIGSVIGGVVAVVGVLR